jgi:alkyl sulfatase BDS1-like metallo-beta-lactamase superfamily hydrolase
VADALQVADELWRGVRGVGDRHPFSFVGSLVEPAPGVAFVPSFANVSALSTDAGLLLVDTGSIPFAASAKDELRRWSPARVDTAVYSHGHVDHVFGVPLYEEEARANGWEPPVVVAHEAITERFERYVLTAGWNAIVNRRQFQLPHLEWPTVYRHPDRTYRGTLDLDVGGLQVRLTHARGETDDHTWTWIPERRTICTGDLFIWASPNAGNPQKVQRYPMEWAQALREMLTLDPGPEVLLPGHGLPLVGADRIRQALDDTAVLLEDLVEQTLRLMNEGARLDDVLHSVRPRQDLLEKPYLRPVYDEPEFVVRNIWRRYGGWWDGDPATLHPAPVSSLAEELADLAGGPSRLADRALELAEQGELRLAGHLAELALRAAPADARVLDVYTAVYGRRAQAAGSTMARGVFAGAAADAEARAAAARRGPDCDPAQVRG